MDRVSVMTQLKFALQALALEAEGQIAAFPDFVVTTDELLLEFDNWYRVVLGNFPEYLSQEQTEILKAIDGFMDNLEPENPDQSIEDELKTSPFWKKMRALARKALTKFNWNSDLPPLDRVTYVKG